MTEAASVARRWAGRAGRVRRAAGVRARRRRTWGVQAGARRRRRRARQARATSGAQARGARDNARGVGGSSRGATTRPRGPAMIRPGRPQHGHARAVCAHRLGQVGQLVARAPRLVFLPGFRLGIVSESPFRPGS